MPVAHDWRSASEADVPFHEPLEMPLPVSVQIGLTQGNYASNAEMVEVVQFVALIAASLQT